MSQDMIYKASTGQFVIRRNHFPDDMDIKYVVLSRRAQEGDGRLSIELTKLDFNLLASTLAGAPVSYEGLTLVGRELRYQGTPILKTRTQSHFAQADVWPRTLIWTVQPLSSMDIAPIAQVLDLIYGFNCFDEHARPRLADLEMRRQLASMSSAPPAAAGIEQRQVQQQVMSMQLKMALEQLAVQEQRPVMIMRQRMEVRILARRVQHSQVLRMSQAELAAYVRRVATSNPVVAVQP
tara:strand:+ start:2123 stop:2833 length:711 start_codon:yes stop_codon:yes gene_type:complete